MAGPVHVAGYTTAGGRQVKGYTRSAPGGRGGYFTDRPLRVQGVEEAVAMLEGVIGRLQNLRPAAPVIYAILDRAYEERWASWDGYLVDTGSLRGSFTEDDAWGAFRRAHVDRIEFGSTIYYARYWASRLLFTDAAMEESIASTVASYFSGDDMPKEISGPLNRLLLSAHT